MTPSFYECTIDLSVMQDNPLPSGSGIEYLEEGSTPGGLLDVDVAGTLHRIAPGDVLTGVEFLSARVRPTTQFDRRSDDPYIGLDGTVSGMTGKARLAVFRGTALHIARPSESKRTLLNSRTDTAVALTASPTLATDGIPVDGCTHFWAAIDANVGATVTGGAVDIWRFIPNYLPGVPTDPGYGVVWALVATEQLPIGVRTVGIPVDLVGLQSGRIAVTPNGVTVSAGVDVNVYLAAR